MARPKKNAESKGQKQIFPLINWRPNERDLQVLDWLENKLAVNRSNVLRLALHQFAESQQCPVGRPETLQEARP
jgi:hypothetical protein